MTYTLKSARFANPENTAAVIDTKEAGAVIVSAADTPEEWAEVLKGVVAPYVRPYPEYIDKRHAEYPPITDQLDAIWKGGADMETLRGKVAAVKARHPKP